MSIDWDNQPIGEVTDAELARRLGVTREAVYDARTRRAISAVPRSSVDWDQVRFGEEPDGRLARALGVSRQAVRQQRLKRGIPPYTRDTT